MLRVKPDVEELVEIVSRKLGYTRATLRNTTILWGLRILLMFDAKLPRTDEEFEELLEEIRQLIRKKLGEENV